MALTKVLITVKTYPTLSAKYEELVCTAGFREDGKLIRLYPVPFRKKAYHEQYKKYDWIEVDLVKNEKDFRPESFRPRTLDQEIKVVGHIDTQRNWEERKQLCLGKIHYDLDRLISEAYHKNIGTSLAVFKPGEIIDFYAEPAEREWSRSKVEKLKQYNLFEANETGAFDVVKRLPYKFKFRFKDSKGKESRLMIEDWETGALYWKQLAKYEGDENRAIADVRKKYLEDFAKTKELYFFLGTTQTFHAKRAPNPFLIIGTFHPKLELQGRLF